MALQRSGFFKRTYRERLTTGRCITILTYNRVSNQMEHFIDRRSA